MPSRSTAHALATRQQSKTILLLEPNRLAASQYITYLERQGYRVVWRQDAQAGVMAADEHRPDLVLAELLLSGHSGIEFLYEFRSYADWAQVPVIIMSSVAWPASGLPENALQGLGVAAYLHKSDLSLAKLGRVLNQLLPAAAAS